MTEREIRKDERQKCADELKELAASHRRCGDEPGLHKEMRRTHERMAAHAEDFAVVLERKLR